jgi:hypothetical protein
MINLKPRPTGGASRYVHVQSARTHITKVVITLLVLAASFLLVNIPTAEATPVLASNHTSSTVDPPSPCRGEKPGICPDNPFIYLS